MAARFCVPDAASKAALERKVTSWPVAFSAAHGIEPSNEFVNEPRVVDRSPDTIDIVFDGMADSRHWKALMVDLVRDVENIAGATFVGFHDVVAGTPHPGFLPKAEDHSD